MASDRAHDRPLRRTWYSVLFSPPIPPFGSLALSAPLLGMAPWVISDGRDGVIVAVIGATMFAHAITTIASGRTYISATEIRWGFRRRKRVERRSVDGAAVGMGRGLKGGPTVAILFQLVGEGREVVQLDTSMYLGSKRRAQWLEIIRTTWNVRVTCEGDLT